MKGKKDKPRGFVFYPQDYLGDVQVRLLPIDLRLIWVECLLLMHESPDRGVLLQQNGQPYTYEELAEIIRGGSTPELIKRALESVVNRGIASIDRASKQVMNRKMVRDEITRKSAQKSGKKGGNPKLLNKKQPSVTASKDNGLFESVKGDDKAELKHARAFPDPEPDPEPDLGKGIKREKKGNGDSALRRRKSKSEAPEKMEISNDMKAWATAEQISVNLESETRKMLDHFRGKGELKSDWLATWRNWMRRAQEINQKNGNGGNGNGTNRQRESNEQAKVRRTLEAARDALDFMHGGSGAGLGSGNIEAESSLVPETTSRPHGRAD